MCAAYRADRVLLRAPCHGSDRRDEDVEVKIGVQHAPREIIFESGQSAEEVEQAVTDALGGKAQRAQPGGRARPQGPGPGRPRGLRGDRRAGHPQGGLRRRSDGRRAGPSRARRVPTPPAGTRAARNRRPVARPPGRPPSGTSRPFPGSPSVPGTSPFRPGRAALRRVPHPPGTPQGCPPRAPGSTGTNRAHLTTGWCARSDVIWQRSARH